MAKRDEKPPMRVTVTRTETPVDPDTLPDAMDPGLGLGSDVPGGPGDAPAADPTGAGGGKSYPFFPSFGGDPNAADHVRVWRGYSTRGLLLGRMDPEGDEDTLRDIGGGGPYFLQMCNRFNVTLQTSQLRLPGDMKPGSFDPDGKPSEGGPAPSVASASKGEGFGLSELLAFMQTQAEQNRAFMTSQLQTAQAANDRAAAAERAAAERAAVSERAFVQSMMDMATRRQEGNANGGDELDKLEKMARVITTIGGGGGGAPENPWISGAKIVSETLRDVLRARSAGASAAVERARIRPRAAIPAAPVAPRPSRYSRPPVAPSPVPAPNPEPAPAAGPRSEAERDQAAELPAAEPHPFDMIEGALGDARIPPETVAEAVLEAARAKPKPKISPLMLSDFVNARPDQVPAWCKRIGRAHWAVGGLRAKLDEVRALLRDALNPEAPPEEPAADDGGAA